MALAFPKKAARPYLQPMMLAIHAAMRERNLDVNGLADALGVTRDKRPAIYNWVAGKNGVSEAYRANLAAVLGLTEAQLTSPQAPGGARPHLGPAQRAVALVQAAPPGAVPTVAAEPVRDVFTISGRSDGQISLRLQVTLDAARGLALARFLMDAGLVVGGDSVE